MPNFDHFIFELQQSLQQPLPDRYVQFQMASMLRKQELLDVDNIIGAKESAVCILLYEKEGDLFFLLIERMVYEGIHSGQIALPGGKKDKTDADLEETALRELWEETGVKVDKKNVIGRLNKLYIPPSNFMVYPIVAFANELAEFRIDEREVQQVLECSLIELLNDDLVKETTVVVGNGLKIKTPYFDIRGKIVWGATAMILNELKFILRSNDFTSSSFLSR